MKIAVRLGLTVIAGVVVFFAANRMLRNFEEAQQHKALIGGAAAGLGALTWAAGRARRMIALRDNPTGADVPEGVPFFSLQFWGPVIALCGGLMVVQARGARVIYQISQKLSVPKTQTAEARETKPSPKPTAKSPSKSANRSEGSRKPEKPIDAFDTTFHLQGIFYRKTGASAMIDGTTVFVGDRLGRGKVKAIDRTTETIEIGSKLHVLRLGE